MSRLVLVGEAPGGSGTGPLPALEGLVGRRLAKMMDVSDELYMSQTVRKNIFETPDQGQRWSLTSARVRAIHMMTDFEDEDLVVLLGARVAKAFSVDDAPLYEWRGFRRPWRGDTVYVARVPHPSGRNRNLNDREERRRMSEFLAGALRAAA
jgi:uracil-DNA glycosylase